MVYLTYWIDFIEDRFRNFHDGPTKNNEYRFTLSCLCTNSFFTICFSSRPKPLRIQEVPICYGFNSLSEPCFHFRSHERPFVPDFYFDLHTDILENNFGVFLGSSTKFLDKSVRCLETSSNSRDRESSVSSTGYNPSRIEFL